jgi:uncharacterized protein (TIGR00251 family)
LVLNVKLQAKASRNEFAGLQAETLRLRIRAPAIEGRASEDLIAFLSSSFGVSTNRVQIERGRLSRIEKVRIQVASQLPDELVSLGLIAATQQNL